jgi:hypothetical protein
VAAVFSGAPAAGLGPASGVVSGAVVSTFERVFFRLFEFSERDFLSSSVLSERLVLALLDDRAVVSERLSELLSAAERPPGAVTLEDAESVVSGAALAVPAAPAITAPTPNAAANTAARPTC